jgi:hypothetical protein
MPLETMTKADSMQRQLFSIAISAALLCLLAFSCREKQAITPCFKILNDSFRDPREPVTFINCSEGADSYIWDFGDGETSTEASPTHQYNSLNSFNVTLRAINKDYDKAVRKTIWQDFPKFKQLIVKRLPKLSPFSGMSLDPDGNGNDLQLEIYRAGLNGPIKIIPPSYQITLPLNIDIENLDINSAYWTFLLISPTNSTRDTAALFIRTLDELLVSPIQEKITDSTEISLIMEGFPL